MRAIKGKLLFPKTRTRAGCHRKPMLMFYVRVETIDGSAEADKDYKPVKKTLMFEKDEAHQSFEIEIMDDNEWEPDEVFFVKMCLDTQDPGSKTAVIGHHSICEVTIINDDGE